MCTFTIPLPDAPPMATAFHTGFGLYSIESPWKWDDYVPIISWAWSRRPRRWREAKGTCRFSWGWLLGSGSNATYLKWPELVLIYLGTLLWGKSESGGIACGTSCSLWTLRIIWLMVTSNGCFGAPGSPKRWSWIDSLGLLNMFECWRPGDFGDFGIPDAACQVTGSPACDYYLIFY